MATGIYKRGNLWWIRYTGLDGRQKRESSFSTRFKEAETLKIGKKQSIKEGKEPEIKRIEKHTFNELVKQYIKWAERQRSFNSKIYLIKELYETFGTLPLRRFNAMLLEQYQSERLKQGNKPATVNRLIATLKNMFTKAVEWDMMESELF